MTFLDFAFTNALNVLDFSCLWWENNLQTSSMWNTVDCLFKTRLFLSLFCPFRPWSLIHPYSVLLCAGFSGCGQWVQLAWGEWAEGGSSGYFLPCVHRCCHGNFTRAFFFFGVCLWPEESDCTYLTKPPPGQVARALFLLYFRLRVILGH